mmetsp:Transcript_39512/g.92331  ORF Transcript_39512/g.92331 Transcript_39512/m.92331 type:complete len:170 (-) Transcript_39512:510-1019(-)
MSLLLPCTFKLLCISTSSRAIKSWAGSYKTVLPALAPFTNEYYDEIYAGGKFNQKYIFSPFFPFYSAMILSNLVLSTHRLPLQMNLGANPRPMFIPIRVFGASIVVIQPPPSFATSLLDSAIFWIKRTFQPSIIRKRRKTGFLKRHKSVGGRRVLKRRKAKGRKRLGGC